MERGRRNKEGNEVFFFYKKEQQKKEAPKMIVVLFVHSAGICFFDQRAVIDHGIVKRKPPEKLYASKPLPSRIRQAM